MKSRVRYVWVVTVLKDEGLAVPVQVMITSTWRITSFSFTTLKPSMLHTDRGGVRVDRVMGRVSSERLST